LLTSTNHIHDGSPTTTVCLENEDGDALNKHRSVA